MRSPRADLRLVKHLGLALLGGLLLAVHPVHADWIATTDGAGFEIQGSWQLKGKLAVFTLPDGTLSSIRADRIDVAASRKLTDAKREAAQAAATPAPPPPARKSVVSLTDKDFNKAPEAAPPAADRKTAGAAGAESEAKPVPSTMDVPGAVQVVNWTRVPAAETKTDGLELTGTLRNTSQRPLAGVTLEASFFDDTGTLIGKAPGTVETQALPAGETSTFRVAASGIFTFATVQWEAHGAAIRPLQGAPAPAAPGNGAAAGSVGVVGAPPAPGTPGAPASPGKEGQAPANAAPPAEAPTAPPPAGGL